jgi:hypothetical protein
MRCNWYNGQKADLCTLEGEHVLIYGCLDQHIGEIIFCKNHLIVWDGMAVDNRAYCPQDNCGNYVADWTTVKLSQVTIGWLRRH